MIVSLHGKLVEKTPAAATLEVGGVGYCVFISLTTYDRLPGTGGDCRLFTYLHIRDDAMILYGFAQTAERQMFEQLINVNGVGPKLALSALSGMTVSELNLAISEGDVKRLSSVHGIGRKTAERMIVELRDKVNPLEALAGRIADGDEKRNTMLRDTILALGALGYPQDQARKMVQIAVDAEPDITDTEALLRKALNRGK